MIARSESWLRSQTDTPTAKMLDLWHQLCRQVIGAPIEVIVANRREYPFHGIDTAQGELNTAIPQTYQDRVVLALLLENTKKLNAVITTHEIGHWVLKLQGLKSMSNGDDPNGSIEISLNSMASHSALYVLQRSLGHEPQNEIDKRAGYNIAVLSRSTEPFDEKVRVSKAMVYADDLLHCSTSNKTGMQRLLSNKHPNINKMVNKILETSVRQDVAKIANIHSFCAEVIQTLELGQNWSEANEVEKLRSDVRAGRIH